jgi:hypothetical protein
LVILHLSRVELHCKLQEKLHRVTWPLRLLHMMNVRFSLLNMAQRILGVTLPNFQWRKPRKCWFRKYSFDGCKHVQYWLTKEIHKYPIKKSKYIYSLPQRLSTYIDLNLHRYGKKNVCGKFLFFNGFSDMTFSLTTSWIISDKSKNQGISEKPLKKRNFPHTFFLPCL